MTISYNNEIIVLPEECKTLEDLITLKNVKMQGTAIALNGNIINKSKITETFLSDNDKVIVITAAFGG